MFIFPDHHSYFVFGHSWEVKSDLPIDSHYYECETGNSYHKNSIGWMLLSPRIPIEYIVMEPNNVNPAITMNYGTWQFIGKTNMPLVGSPPSIITLYIWKRTA